MYDLCFSYKIISLYGEFILYRSSQGQTDLTPRSDCLRGFKKFHGVPNTDLKIRV